VEIGKKGRLMYSLFLIPLWETAPKIAEKKEPGKKREAKMKANAAATAERAPMGAPQFTTSCRGAHGHRGVRAAPLGGGL